MNIKCFSPRLSVFHGRTVPEDGVIVGYGAIIDVFKLAVPIPNKLSFVSSKNRKFEKDEWKVYPAKYNPDENLYKQLIFALKYEGVNLLVLKKLFEVLSSVEMEEMIQQENLGSYSRRIWFLYEWLIGKN